MATTRHSRRRDAQRNAIPPTPGDVDAPVKPNSAATRAFIEPERRHTMISEAAYFRSEGRSFCPGRKLDDWLAAESEIDRSLTSGGSQIYDRDPVELRAERKDFPFFERQLRARWLALRAEIRDVLRRADDEQYAQLAGQVHDAEDESVADLLVDINLAEITRDVEELRDVEAALKRIALGTYGVCVRCGEAIARERLGAYLAAKRCTGCQRLHEQTRAKRPAPTL